MAEDLEAFLQQQAAGGQWESQGHFTIDLLRAQAEFFRNVFPELNLFVLKLIQGCVRHGATRIDVVTQGDCLVLRAALKLDLAEMEAALRGNPLELADSPMRDLAMGVGASLALARGSGLTCAALDYQQMATRTLLGDEARCPKIKEPGLVFWCADVRLKDLLSQRCGYCPVPLTLNREPVSSPERADAYALGERFVLAGEGAPLAVDVQGDAVYGDPQAECPWPPNKPVWLRQAVSNGKPARLAAGKRYPMRQAASLPRGLAGPTELHLVRHGVALDPIELVPDFGAQVVLPGDEVRVDASTLKAVHGPELAGRSKEAAELLEEARAPLMQMLGLAPTAASRHEAREMQRRHVQQSEDRREGLLEAVANLFGMTPNRGKVRPVKFAIPPAEAREIYERLQQLGTALKPLKVLPVKKR